LISAADGPIDLHHVTQMAVMRNALSGLYLLA